MIKPFCNCRRIIRNLFSQLLLYLFIGSLRKFFLFFNFNNFRFFNSLNWIALTLKFTFPTKFQSRIKIFPKPFSIIARILHHSIEPIGRMMSMIKMKFTCNKVQLVQHGHSHKPLFLWSITHVTVFSQFNRKSPQMQSSLSTCKNSESETDDSDYLFFSFSHLDIFYILYS